MRSVIAELFHGNGRWRHKRIDAELEKAKVRISKLHAIASKGGTRAKINRDIMRSNVAHATAPAAAHATAKAAANGAHNYKEDISSTVSVAARASDAAPPEPASTTEVAAPPAGFAEDAAAPPKHKIGSPALAAAMQRKGWVR
jgi:hypothetical protein